MHGDPHAPWRLGPTTPRWLTIKLVGRVEQDLLHHVCGVGVIFGAMMRRSVTEYVPRFLILESSTVFLDIMWVLKESGMANTALYTVRAWVGLSTRARRARGWRRRLSV